MLSSSLPPLGGLRDEELSMIGWLTGLVRDEDDGEADEDELHLAPPPVNR